MRLSIRHATTYRYAAPVRSVIQLLRMTPSSFASQTVLDWRLDVDCDARVREGRDGYGNIIHMLYIDRPVRDLQVTVTGRVLTEDEIGVVRGLAVDLPAEVFLRETALTEGGAAIEAFAGSPLADEEPILDRLHLMNSALNRDMRFDTEATIVETKAEDALAAGHGVCQDFAHILIGAARCLGIPARYVSGHLFRRDGAHIQQAAHAWAEAWVPDLGWVAFDPANGKCPDDAYVRVACGLDYRDAAPIAGNRRGGGTERLSVEVDVRESQAQWQGQS
ncbi:MAG: transglutaminase family protein [Alphaproteobacteria bacterium]|nr:transglutaminase family protein [Alphaproteobacteria bacterium]MDB5721331.1 transglutaminase family protein [Alphaproteobacteria bacterium]